MTKIPFAIIINYLLILISEKMKNLFGIIAIALLFSFAGLQEASAADWTISVTFTDECDGCPTVGDYEYVVCIQIRNTCTQTDIHSDCQILSSSDPLSWDFDVDHVCTVDEQVCYQVTAVVVKRCVIGQTQICRDSNSQSKSCEDIYNGFPLPCALE